ncbi:MAG: hypothetical protein ABW110_04440 [Steroidobacteraceae bacterium]
MSHLERFESVLIVFQNPVAGRQDSYDDWYTNIHIRDALRLDGALATQRFIVSEHQLTISGQRVVPAHWAHTIYEWESAKKSVEGHAERAGTPAMEISKDGSFDNLRDYFYRPVHLSHGWTLAEGFRRGTDVLTAMIVPAAGAESDFTRWFVDEHVQAALALPGFASVALFRIHEQQSLPTPCRFPLAAVYSLSDAPEALLSWERQFIGQRSKDPTARAQEVELTCWKPRIPRLLARDVVAPTPAAAAEEQRARGLYKDRYYSRADMLAVITD